MQIRIHASCDNSVRSRSCTRPSQRRHSTDIYHSNGQARCALALVHMHAGATRVTGQHSYLFGQTGSTQQLEAQQRCSLPHIDAVLARNDGCIGGGTMYSLQLAVDCDAQASTQHMCQCKVPALGSFGAGTPPSSCKPETTASTYMPHACHNYGGTVMKARAPCETMPAQRSHTPAAWEHRTPVSQTS